MLDQNLSESIKHVRPALLGSSKHNKRLLVGFVKHTRPVILFNSVFLLLINSLYFKLYVAPSSHTKD